MTVVYAVFACGAIVALLCERRRGADRPSLSAMTRRVATMMTAAAIGAGKALPGLLVGRVIIRVPAGLQPELPPPTS